MTSRSKYRNVFCKPLEHEDCMSNVRVTDLPWDSSSFCGVNPKFIAFINKKGAGSFMVIPVNKRGKIDDYYPFVNAHYATCFEIAWNPFNDNIIASCSEDTTAKVWAIPENGLTRILSEPAMILSGHQKRVNTMAWHPAANNILITAGGDKMMLMWNVGTGEAFCKISCHPDPIWSISFNHNGSQFVTTCKDRMIRVFDSYTSELLCEGVGHEGFKTQRAIFVKYGLIWTTGFTKRSEGVFALRSPESLSNPIFQEKFDSSKDAIFPFYDEGTGLVYLVGKSDRAIRYYEINKEPPFVHYINTYIAEEYQRAVAFQSKRGVSTKDNEINRIYKFTDEGVLEVLRFFVPKKIRFFQHDLYPYKKPKTPALTAEEFMKGFYPHWQHENAAGSKLDWLRAYFRSLFCD